MGWGGGWWGVGGGGRGWGGEVGGGGGAWSMGGGGGRLYSKVWTDAHMNATGFKPSAAPRWSATRPSTNVRGSII